MAQIIISQHIYIYAVGLITWPFFGKSRVNNLAMVELITWPSIFEPMKIGFFLRFFGAQLSGGGAKLVFLKKKFGQKTVSKNKICAPIFWGS